MFVWNAPAYTAWCGKISLFEHKLSVPAQACERKRVAIMKNIHLKSAGTLQTATDVDKNVNVIIAAVTRGSFLKKLTSWWQTSLFRLACIKEPLSVFSPEELETKFSLAGTDPRSPFCWVIYCLPGNIRSAEHSLLSKANTEGEVFLYISIDRHFYRYIKN